MPFSWAWKPKILFHQLIQEVNVLLSACISHSLRWNIQSHLASTFFTFKTWKHHYTAGFINVNSSCYHWSHPTKFSFLNWRISLVENVSSWFPKRIDNMKVHQTSLIVSRLLWHRINFTLLVHSSAARILFTRSTIHCVLDFCSRRDDGTSSC